MQPATIGMPLAQVDTPALVIDLDAFERNLQRMAGFAAKSGVRLRAHAKTHKSPVIAAKQVALGAVGVCCQKVSEAEVLVDGGIRDVLISNEVAGAAKLDRLAALARRAPRRVRGRRRQCGGAGGGRGAGRRDARRAGRDRRGRQPLRRGAGRAGGAPRRAGRGGAAPRLRRPAGLPRLGAARARGRRSVATSSRGRRSWSRRRGAPSLAIGLEARIVSGAGTGTYEFEAASGVWNELQCGSYVFMDADYARNKRADGSAFDDYEHALFVYATVMSMPVPERAVVDAGLKALAVDSGMPAPWRLPGAAYHRPSDEHGVLDLSQCPVRLRARRQGAPDPRPLRPHRQSARLVRRRARPRHGRARASSACGRWRPGARCSEWA